MSEPPTQCPECARLARRLAGERRARLAAEAIAERFTRDAMRDPLTGLSNRSQLLYRLELALNRAARLGTRVGTLFLDLDDFKAVNDSLGHAAGDRLLHEVGRRLTSLVRSSDLVSRLGGDEFVVVCEDARDEQQMHRLAERVEDCIGQPLLVDSHRLSIRASIGMCFADGTRGAESVLHDADSALYEAKKAAGGGHVSFRGQTRARGQAGGRESRGGSLHLIDELDSAG